MEFIPGFLFMIGVLVGGGLFLVGTWRQWPFFVDPPEGWWAFYSQSFIKKIFGRTGLLIYNYFLGVLFIFCGLIGLWNGIKQILSQSEP